MAAELDLARGLGPESPGAPSKQEMQQGQDYDEEDEEDALSPLNPVKTIRMKRPRNQRKETTAANRLAGGRSTRDWDVGGNSAKNLSALEELVAGASRDMNAAEASMRLQAMLSAGDTSQDQLKLRKSFGDEVNEELLSVLRKDDRTESDVDIIERHVSWHAIFKDLKPLMRRKMCRALTCKEFSYGDVIVVQGDAADSFCVVYAGDVSVHCWKDGREFKGMRSNKPHGSLAANRADLLEKVPHIIGGRVGVLRQGNSFGENGMDPSGKARRSATCIATTPRTILLELCRHDLIDHSVANGGIKAPSHDLIKALKKAPDARLDEDLALIDDAVGGDPFFAELDHASRLQIVQNLTVEAFRRDRAVVLQDDRADAFLRGV